MGYDLVGMKSDFRFNIWEWPVCLKIAKAFGWRAMGTIDPWDRAILPWSGDYMFNEHQLVTKEDALRMASALRLAIKAAEELSALVVRDALRPSSRFPPAIRRCLVK